MKSRPPRKCDECGKLAEWPQTLATAMIPNENGEMIEYEYPFCEDCLETMRWEDDRSKAAQRGEVCALCYQELNPPGGSTLDLGEPWFPEMQMPRIIRVCQSCADSLRR